MNKRIVFILSAAFLAVLALPFGAAQAQPPLPPNSPEQGLVYDGLQVNSSGPCPGGYELKIVSKGQVTFRCSPGPDAAPAGISVTQRNSPARPAAAAPTGAIVCDGDGVTGKRVEVLYVRNSTTPSRFAQFLSTFQTIAAQVDDMFELSAQQTGDHRHVRYVTDANCSVQVTEVVLSATGTNSLYNTTNELYNLGYNRTDRKYMLFADAYVYCGISTMLYDDLPGSTNLANTGPQYARVDVNCWADNIAGHELMHTFGAVQASAPHADVPFTNHCSDGYDNMCDHGPNTITVVCADTKNGDRRFDCNKDDYFSTNPAPGSYLEKHWNTANSQFLIASNEARISSTASNNVTIGAASLGVPIADTLTIGGPATNPAPTGQIQFGLCRDTSAPFWPVTSSSLANGCMVTDPTLTWLGSPVTIKNSKATSPSYAPNTPGLYCFVAQYQPDAAALVNGYTSSTHTNSDTECFVVQSPTVVQLASLSAYSNVPGSWLALGALLGLTSVAWVGRSRSHRARHR